MVGRMVLYSDSILIHTYDRGKSINYMLLDKGDRYIVLNVCIAGRWRKVLYSDSKQF